MDTLKPGNWLLGILMACAPVLIAGCATTSMPARSTTARAPIQNAPPPVSAAAAAPAPQWQKVRSAITSEAKEGAGFVSGGARKGVSLVRSGADKVISGTDKVINLAHFKSDTCTYPYAVCARPGQLSNCGFCWPTIGTVSRGFKGAHDGLDILASTGTPVYAAKSGSVIYAGNKLSGYGNVVILDHGDKVASIYGHNSKLLVGTGDNVQRGQQIACVGQTGRATAPHCHFEVRQNGTPVDPKPLLP